MRPKKEQFSVETIIVFLKANRGFSCAVLKIYDCWFFFRVFFFPDPTVVHDDEKVVDQQLAAHILLKQQCRTPS